MINILLTFIVGITLLALIIIGYLKYVNSQLTRHNRQLNTEINNLSLENERLQEALHAVNQRAKVEQAVNQLDAGAVADGLQSDYRD